MSKFTFILNPQAGKGSGKRLRDKIYRAIKSRTSDFDFIETVRRGHATEIARDTPSQCVVAIGGDGTIHEIVNGIAGTSKSLGVVPIGSGNDFVKSIRVSKSLEQSISSILTSQTSEIDIGRVEVTQNGDGQGNSCASHFVNGVGIGFDAAVAERTRHIPFVSGMMLYFVAVLQTLGRYKSPEFSISIDGRETQSRNLLIAVGNGICAGGGFYLTPDARVDDEMLDMCMIGEISTPSILALMPSVMKGTHRRNPHVKFEKGTRIVISASKGVCAHSDGEILGTDVTAVRIGIVPKALRVIVGRGYEATIL